MNTRLSYTREHHWHSLWRRKLRPITGVCSCMLIGAILMRGNAMGASLIWDSNAAGIPNPLNGNGVWQTANSWWNPITPAITSWSNATPDDATFGTGSTGTTAYGVSLGSATTAGTLNFANHNYTINNLSAVPLTIHNGITAATASGTVNTPVVLGAANTWNVGATRTLFMGGAVSGGFGVTKTGSGTARFNGAAANIYTGPTTVSAGTLVLDFAKLATATNLIDSSSVLVLGNGTLSVIGKTTGATLQTFASTTINGGSAVTVNSSGGAGTTQTLGAITRQATGTVNFTPPASGAITTTSANTAGTILGGWATVAGTDWAVSAGDGTNPGNITALAPAGYTNDTWSTGNNTTVTGISTVPLNGTTHSLRFNAPVAATINLAGTNTITSGGLLVTAGVGSQVQTISGGIGLTSGTSELIIHNHANSGFFSLQINSKITGAIGLTKSGPGNLRIGSANDFTGPTTVNSGALIVGNASALASTSSITVRDGGALAFAAVGGISLLNLPTLTISGQGVTGSGAALNNSTAGSTAVLISPLNLNGTATVGGNVQGSWLLGGPIRGSGGVLQVVGSGVVALAGDNTYSGGTIFSSSLATASVADERNLGGANTSLTFAGGALKIIGTALNSFGTHPLLYNSGVVTLLDVQDSANTFLIDRTINPSGAGFTKSGAGSLRFTADNGVTGNTIINGGDAILDFTSSNGVKFAAGNTVTLGGARLSTLGAAAATLLARGLLVTSGASTIDLGASSYDFTNMSGTLTRNAGGTLDFVLGAGTITLPTNLAINTGWATVGNDFAKLNGSNQVTAFTAGDYTTLGGAGPVIVSGSSTVPLVSSASTGNVTLAAAATVNLQSLNIKDATARTIDLRNGSTQEILRVATVGAILTTGGSHTIGLSGTAGTLTAGGTDGAAGELIVNNNSALTINSAITNNAGGVVTFTKSGPGLLTLTGTNTYTGQTYLNAGVTSIGALAQLGTGTTINFNGGTLRTANTFFFGRTLTFNSNGGTLDVTAGTLTIDFIANGVGGLTKTGAGTLVLNSSSTFHGGVTINDGIVRLNNNSSLLGPLTLAGSGRLQLNGTSFATTALNSASTSAIIESNSGLGGTDTLAVGNGGANTYAGILRDGSTRALALHKTGAGTLSLTNNGHTFTGGTTVSGGKLRVDGTIGAVTVQDGGTLGGSGTVGAVIVQNGGTLAPGSSPAIFNTAALNLNSGAHLAMEINGVTAGSTYDRVVTSGAVNLNADAGTGAILDLTLGYVPSVGDLFFLIVNGDSGSTLGTFATLPNLDTVFLVSSANSQTYEAEVTYFANLGTNSFTGGNDFAVRIVPEPTSCLLFASGALLLGLRRRRMR